MAIVPRAASPAPIVIDRAPNRADSRGPSIDIMVKVKASGPPVTMPLAYMNA